MLHTKPHKQVLCGIVFRHAETYHMIILVTTTSYFVPHVNMVGRPFVYPSFVKESLWNNEEKAKLTNLNIKLIAEVRHIVGLGE